MNPRPPPKPKCVFFVFFPDCEAELEKENAALEEAASTLAGKPGISGLSTKPGTLNPKPSKRVRLGVPYSWLLIEV